MCSAFVNVILDFQTDIFKIVPVTAVGTVEMAREMSPHQRDLNSQTLKYFPRLNKL
jgi:hypothetical protein